TYAECRKRGVQSSGAAADSDRIRHSEMSGEFLFKLFHFPSQLYAVIAKRRAIAQHMNRGFYFFFVHVVDARKFQRQRFGANRRASMDRQLFRFRLMMAWSNSLFAFYRHKSPI